MTIIEAMQTIKINLNAVTQEQIDLIVDYLKRGQVMAYPTDTVYGLGCDARNESAIKKIKKIKGQNDNKPLLVLISDFAMLKQYCAVDQAQAEYLEKIWLAAGQDSGLKPVTVILESRGGLPACLTGGLNSLAVRLPKNEFLIKIISQAGFPLVSTSLNKTGQALLSNLKNLGDYFEILPDLVIDAGECVNTKPSRLVDLRDMENVKVIRE